MNRKGLAVGIVLLFLVSTVPFINGESDLRRGEDSFKDVLKEDYQQYKDDWSVHITNQSNDDECIDPMFNNEVLSRDADIKPSPISGPMDSAWPMQGHDVNHTCRSPYSTENNTGTEIWQVRGDEEGTVESSAVIDSDGIIYFGTMASDTSLYALYPNGTRKWRFSAMGLLWGTPAIADDGTLYFTTWGAYHYFYALTPNGTAKWLFAPGDASCSSPAIGEDNTIYFGSDDMFIYAVNPNGTQKWRYITSDIVMGSPAIGQDGTIYIGSGDYYLYALYPNGTLRWRFNTGSKIKGDASIGEDGTIYVPAFNSYFYALYPDGTLKWKGYTGSSIAGAGVALAEDGTIYIGTELLRAYYPNGTLKWSTDLQGDLYGTVPAVSADGTIYVSAGGSLVAVNPDGTERWRKQLTIAQIRSSPSIGSDDRVYVGSEDYGLSAYGYLHAFGLGPLRAEAGGPYQGTSLRPITLIGLAFGGLPPYQYHWDFGDGNTSAEINPTHTYAVAGNYTVTFTITDAEGNISMDAASVTMDYPLPVLVITRPTNAFYIADKQLFPVSFPFIFGKITIKANVTYHYPITRVEFIIHGANQYTDTIPPYEWTWTQRNFRLKDNIYVIAYDTKGRYTEQKMDVIKWF